MTCDFQQCAILTSLDSDEPVQPPVKFRNTKLSSISSFTSLIKRQAKALISLRVCAGWSEPLLVAHTTLLEISFHGSFVAAVNFVPAEILVLAANFVLAGIFVPAANFVLAGIFVPLANFVLAAISLLAEIYVPAANFVLAEIFVPAANFVLAVIFFCLQKF